MIRGDLNRLSFPRKLILLGAMFSLALGFRLWEVTTDPPQADELHWVERSRKVIAKYEEGRLDSLTTHLGHPGVVPGLLMAGAQRTAKWWNEHQSTPGHRLIDDLSASRLMNALVSSLVVIVLVLGSAHFVGFPTAAFAGFLLALDPRHIAVSRMAHLDTILAVLVVITVCSYLSGWLSHRLMLRLVAGISWGLAISIKPTAGMLLVGLFLVKVSAKLFQVLSRSDPSKARSVIEWSDLGVFFLGHVVFALLYTRLWVHESDYKVRLAVESGLADTVYALGMFVQSQPLVIACFAAFFCFCLFQLVGRSEQRLLLREGKSHYHLLMGIITTAIAFTVLATVPQVLENIIRFWTWAAGLSGETHRAYGVQVQPVHAGYLTIIGAELPTIAIVGLALAVCSVWFPLEGRSRIFLFSLIVISCCWVFLLNISGKQTIRYVLPIIPFLYLLAAAGFRDVLATFFRRSRKLGWLGGVLLVGLQTMSTASWHPNYLVFFNAISGGLPAAVARKHPLAPIGHGEAIRYLMEQGADRARWIAVVGDLQIVDIAYRRMSRGSPRILNFESPWGVEQTDFVMVFQSFFERIPDSLNVQLVGQEPVFRYLVSGVSLLDMYFLPIESYVEPHKFRLATSPHWTGKVEPVLLESEASGSDALVARPGRDKAGHLLFGKVIRFNPGNYVATFSLRRIEDRSSPPPPVADTTPVVDLEVGRNCRRTLQASELVSGETFSLRCNFANERSVQARVYWYGNVGVLLSGLTVVTETSEKSQ